MCNYLSHFNCFIRINEMLKGPKIKQFSRRLNHYPCFSSCQILLCAAAILTKVIGLQFIFVRVVVHSGYT